MFTGFRSEPARSRTEDPILKRDVLYQLSYWFLHYFFGMQNYNQFFVFQIFLPRNINFIEIISK